MRGSGESTVEGNQTKQGAASSPRSRSRRGWSFPARMQMKVHTASTITRAINGSMSRSQWPFRLSSPLHYQDMQASPMSPSVSPCFG